MIGGVRERAEQRAAAAATWACAVAAASLGQAGPGVCWCGGRCPSSRRTYRQLVSVHGLADEEHGLARVRGGHGQES